MDPTMLPDDLELLDLGKCVCVCRVKKCQIQPECLTRLRGSLLDSDRTHQEGTVCQPSQIRVSRFLNQARDPDGLISRCYAITIVF